VEVVRELGFSSYVMRGGQLTMSLWRDDASMANFAYRPDLHRTLADHYKAEHTADRTSFTRCRIMRTVGQWGGTDPVSMIGPSPH
jgi:hypothetical protein